MDGLILFSHGSLLCGAGETLKQHAREIEARGGFSVVEVGFLNYSEPTLAAAVERCVEAGVERVVVVPYFLVPGYFVNTVLPRHVRQAGERHPGLRFVIAEPLGYDSLLADSLLDLADHARTADRWREDLERAGAFCEADPGCQLYATPRCPRVPSPLPETVPA